MIKKVSYDTFSAVFLVDRCAMIAYIYTHQPTKGGRHGTLRLLQIRRNRAALC